MGEKLEKLKKWARKLKPKPKAQPQPQPEPVTNTERFMATLEGRHEDPLRGLPRQSIEPAQPATIEARRRVSWHGPYSYYGTPYYPPIAANQVGSNIPQGEASAANAPAGGTSRWKRQGKKIRNMLRGGGGSPWSSSLDLTHSSTGSDEVAASIRERPPTAVARSGELLDTLALDNEAALGAPYQRRLVSCAGSRQLVPTAGQTGHRRSGSEPTTPTTPTDLHASGNEQTDDRKFNSERSLLVCPPEDGGHSGLEEPLSTPYQEMENGDTQSRFASMDDIALGMGRKPSLCKTFQDFQNAFKETERNIALIGKKTTAPDVEDPLSSYSRVADILSKYGDSDGPKPRGLKVLAREGAKDGDDDTAWGVDATAAILGQTDPASGTVGEYYDAKGMIVRSRRSPSTALSEESRRARKASSIPELKDHTEEADGFGYDKFSGSSRVRSEHWDGSRSASTHRLAPRAHRSMGQRLRDVVTGIHHASWATMGGERRHSRQPIPPFNLS